MRAFLTIALLAVAATFTLRAADDSPFKSSKEKASYALGANIGKQLKQNGAEIDVEVYVKGLKEAMGGGKVLLTDEQVRETLMTFQKDLRDKTLDKNKKEGETFLVENRKKEGVVTTPSGLQYQVITKGTGKLPTSNDTQTSTSAARPRSPGRSRATACSSSSPTRRATRPARSRTCSCRAPSSPPARSS